MKLIMLIKMCSNETYSKVHIGKHLSDSFPIQNGLKHGDALSPLFFNIALEFPIREVQEIQVGLKLNGRHQLLAYMMDVNLQGDGINTVKKNTCTLVDASEEISLEIKGNKSMYGLLFYHQNTGQNHDVNLANRLFENVSVQTFGKNINKSKFDSRGN
jgi:hypothetical protein